MRTQAAASQWPHGWRGRSEAGWPVWLAAHAIHAQFKRADGSGREAAERLLSQVSDAGADLVVMGGYAHPRVREYVLGGATRTMLESMTVPVLMSH
jgi:nucleotide-binding universal stress UspA family protein